jgi:signal transduction histidine kinase
MSNHFSDVHDALLHFVREQMADPVIVLDEQGRVVGANRAATAWGDLEILAAFSVVGGVPDPRIAGFWNELRDKGSAKAELYNEGDGARHFELAGFAVGDRYVIHARESTAVATSLIHDLNDVLAPILLLSGVLRRESSERTKRMALEIETAAARAAAIARRLRALPRPVPPPVELVDVGAAVQAMRAVVEDVVGEDVTVAIEVEDGIPSTLVDRERLLQVIINLAANARDAMPDGGRLTLRVAEVLLEGAQAQVAGAHVALFITDSGGNMGSRSGSELGITAARSLASDTGGLLSISNQPGRGALIALYFPRAERR